MYISLLFFHNLKFNFHIFLHFSFYVFLFSVYTHLFLIEKEKVKKKQKEVLLINLINGPKLYEYKMASRILTFVSCTLYFFLLLNITIIGFASLIVGSVGVGLFIPTLVTYDSYQNNTCLIVDIEYDTCGDSCYYIMWSVEYYRLNQTSSQYTFSTITQTYNTLDEILQKFLIYKFRSNHTCYYDKTKIVRVQWDEPSSPKPYLIMMVMGFSLTGVYLILITIFYRYRSQKMTKSISSI